MRTAVTAVTAPTDHTYDHSAKRVKNPSSPSNIFLQVQHTLARPSPVQYNSSVVPCLFVMLPCTLLLLNCYKLNHAKAVTSNFNQKIYLLLQT